MDSGNEGSPFYLSLVIPAKVADPYVGGIPCSEDLGWIHLREAEYHSRPLNPRGSSHSHEMVPRPFGLWQCVLSASKAHGGSVCDEVEPHASNLCLSSSQFMAWKEDAFQYLEDYLER